MRQAPTLGPEVKPEIQKGLIADPPLGWQLAEEGRRCRALAGRNPGGC
jgi:hypothetical protein